MSSFSIKSALKHAAAWGTVVGFVSLLTIIFSFLGTLFCAAAGGMMMGATKAHKALAFAFSVLCPGVLIGTMAAQRSELARRQVVVLAMLCLAIFWVLYFLAMFLVAYEKSSNVADPSRNGASQGLAEKPAPTNNPAPLRVLHLAELEGHWLCAESTGNGHAQKRILEIRKDSLALSTIDAQGRVCTCAGARMALLDSTGVEPTLLETSAEIAAGI